MFHLHISTSTRSSSGRYIHGTQVQKILLNTSEVLYIAKFDKGGVKRMLGFDRIWVTDLRATLGRGGECCPCWAGWNQNIGLCIPQPATTIIPVCVCVCVCVCERERERERAGVPRVAFHFSFAAIEPIFMKLGTPVTPHRCTHHFSNDIGEFLWIKPTDALNSNFSGITTLHVSGNLSAYHQEFLAVHRLWYILYSYDDRVGWNWPISSILLRVAHGHRNCIKCTKADERLRTPDDGQKGCPKHVE